MRMNHEMEALYGDLVASKTKGQIYLDSNLLALLEPGFAQKNGAVVLRSRLNFAKSATVADFPDLTGYECFVNHIHIEDYVRNENPRSVMMQGFGFADRLLESLSASFPRNPFTVIFACNKSGCSVRFHSTRRGEQWLSDNLNKYKERLLVLETPTVKLEEHNDVTTPRFVVDFGDRQRRSDFSERFRDFLLTVDSLREVWELAFKHADTTTQDARVFTFMARMAVEDDFCAMILLCANAHSNGSKQILRALFEKVVTLGYLHKHPEEIERFNNFSWIHRRKQLGRIGPILAGKLKKKGQESIKEIKAEAAKLKDQFNSLGWSKLGTVAMAYDIGLPLQVVEVGYYWGLAEAHPTTQAILNRFKVDERTDSLWYQVLPDLDECTLPLMIGHYLVLVAIEFLAEQFKTDPLKEALPQAWVDFKKVWTEA